MPRLSPKHTEKLEAALRANLLKRKEQARAIADDKTGKTLPMETPPVKDTKQ